MKTDDIIGVVVFGGFGLWLVLFPGSVIRFYTWFHRGKVRMPSAVAIRCIGIGWLVVFSSFMLFG